MTRDGVWQRTCYIDRHNKGRGERELRGERRGKGGRTLLATAAPSFFIPLLCVAQASGQRIEVHVGAGVVASSALVRDEVATPALRQLLGGDIRQEVTVQPGLGPALSVAARVAARPRVAVEIDAGWSLASLQVDEDGSTRTTHDVQVIEGSLGANWQLRDGLEVGAAAGVLGYLSARRGLFLDGSEVAPTVRGTLSYRVPAWNGRVSLRLAGQAHRFGTAAIRSVGGTDGFVTRLQLGARVRLLELSR